jgi:poly(hydroxyalkanoate) depolymerase family esterase
VVVLHGCTQDAADVARGTRIEARAADAGAMVLMPEQGVGDHLQRCWHWYAPAHAKRDSGEAALIADLARTVATELGVSPRRVHLMGLSAGGAMAVNLAALFPDLFASVAVHSAVPALAGTDLGTALEIMRAGASDIEPLTERVLDAMGERARAVPLLAVHGAADAVVSVKAGRALVAQWEGVHLRLGGVHDAVRWKEIPGLGHAWSGGDPAGTYTAPDSPEVTTEMLRFLLEHPMPRGR